MMMRWKWRGALVMLGLAIMGWTAWTWGQQSEDVMWAPAKLKLENASLDDALVALAEAANFNLIADATQLPSEPQPVEDDTKWGPEIQKFLRDWERYPLTGEWEGRVRFFLDDGFNRNYGITFRKANAIDRRLLLAWTMPDIDELLAQVKAGVDVPLLEPVPHELELSPLLQQSVLKLKRLRIEQVETPGFQLTVPLREFPPNVRRAIMAYAQDFLMRRQIEFHRVYYTDAFWNRAKLRLHADTTSSPPIQLLSVGVEEKNWGTRTAVWNSTLER